MYPKYKNKYYYFLFFFIITSYFFIYSKLIINDPILSRDDQFLVLPLFKINSLSEYINGHQSGLIKDIQPIRDLTFWINVKFIQFFNISTFHFTNLLITLGLIFSFFKLLSHLNLPSLVIFIVTLLLAFHPILCSSVGWISARKHTLSILFAILLLKDLFKNHAITKKTICFYALSIFSHPITLLLPFWLIILKRQKVISKLSIKFYFLCSIGITTLYLNYYKFILLGTGNTSYIENRSFFSTLSTAVLSFGRSIQLIFLPSNISATYFEGNPLNLFGIVLFGIILLFFFKKLESKLLTTWGSLFLLINATYIQYFMNDTYLYLPLITQTILVAYLITNLNLSTKKLITFSTIIFSYFIILTYSNAPMWLSDIHLWKKSYENEGSPETQMSLGVALVKSDPQLSFKLMSEASTDINFYEKYNSLGAMCYFTYKNPVVSTEEKLEVINRLNIQYPNLAIITSTKILLQLSESPFEAEKAYKELQKLSKDSLIKDRKSLELLIVELNYVCEDSSQIPKVFCEGLKDISTQLNYQLQDLRPESESSFLAKELR